MEEMVNNIVNNTFKINNIETAKKIIIDKILWYEMKILNLEGEKFELEEALIDMVNQFAYDEKRNKVEDELLYTGGLSALENAFSVLGIDEGIRREDLWKKI